MVSRLGTKQKKRKKRRNSLEVVRVEYSQIQEIEIIADDESEPSAELEELEIHEFCRIIADILQRELVESKS